ncbi:MAG: hypothetical protein KAJ32_01450 [Gammaproteobacteria bacterium]|nr:hypothetical protein [Gammaproteobacteria bacterium]
MMLYKIILLTALLAMTSAAHTAEVSIHKNEVSGLLTWTVDDIGFKVEFIQLLPDFIRAIYAKHNFPAEEVERAASYCVFGTILKNTSDKHMSYRVDTWRYRPKAEQGLPVKELPVKTKTQWLEEWRKAGILFSWTLLPDTGEFAVGDWQQGFTTIKLPRESKFDLIYKWQLDGVAYSGILEDMQCAPETLPDVNS